MATPTQKSKKKKKQLRIRGRELMLQTGIIKINDLKDMLKKRGIEISNAQLGRFLDNTPTKLDRDLLAGLMQIFNCTPAEFFTLD